MIRLIVRPAAEADIQESCSWYLRNDTALADKFIDELRATLRRIREMPRQFPDVGGARRALFHRFSYAVYFVLPNESHVIVIAVVRQSRKPATWITRLKSEGAG
jgi:plasmid stabilization system protein ParE